MMTTGYDCPDILNLALMRPVFSPTDFIQIKGRGTRKHDFSDEITDPAWKKKVKDEAWFAGDTANMAIGQGFLGVTPLQMACFAASVARKETFTQPTLEHRAEPRAQHNESIGLTNLQYSA